MASDVLKYSSNDSSNCNVALAIQTHKKILFTESFIVVGNTLEASDIQANYDLRIMGDVEAENITVLGNLYVSGDINAKRITCSKKITCDGDISAQEIIADDSIFASNITCDSVSALEIIVRESIDAQEIKVEGNVIAGDGIIGHGEISSNNVIAINYFDFSGTVDGELFDLSEKNHVVKNSEDKRSFEEKVNQFSKMIYQKMSEWTQEDDELFLEKIIDLGISIPDLKSTMEMAAQIIEYTYENSISNLYDFLILIWAKKTFPKEVQHHETIRLALFDMYEDAVLRINSLQFDPESIEEVIIALYIIVTCRNILPVPFEQLLEKVLITIGLRYSTVLQLLNRKS